MTYDYSWVPKIRTFEGNWIRKKFVSSQVKLSRTNVFVKVIAFGKAWSMKMKHFEKKNLSIKFSEKKCKTG